MPYPDGANMAAPGGPYAPQMSKQEVLNTELDNAQHAATAAYHVADNAAMELGVALGVLMRIAVEDGCAKPEHISVVNEHEPHLLATARAFALAVAEFRIAVEVA